MQDEWTSLVNYPGYSISRSGQIRNEKTRRLLTQAPFSTGTPGVSLYVHGTTIRRQVSSFMVEAWLDKPANENFDTPMHLDGDRENCHIDNLVLRPRWFVIQYHKECLEDRFPRWTRPFRIVETGEVFNNPRECATTYGFLQKDIATALRHSRLLFPGAVALEYV